jgi:formate/nitrite transporter FocA (FNT family)
MRRAEKRFRPRGGSESLERAVRVVRPGRRDLAALGAEFHLHEGLLKQMQDTSLAPGFVELNAQLLVRLGVPEAEGKDRLHWLRVDVVVTGPAVLIVEERELGATARAFTRLESREEPASSADVLAVAVEGAVDGFDDTCQELAREFEALKEIGLLGKATSGGPLAEVRDQLRDLERGTRGLQTLLSALAKREHPMLTADGRAQLRASHDRLTNILEHAGGILEKINQAAEETAGREVELGVESPEIVQAAADLGTKRLARLTIGHAITALIGGMSVSFGGVAMAVSAGPFVEALGAERAHLIAAMAFPVGFIMLIVGKGELFTENFFVPVTGVIAGRGSVKDLLVLWSSTLAFNLVGGVIFAFLISRPGVISESARAFMIELGHAKVSMPFGQAFMKGIFAGWLMTVLTWLLLAARGQSGRLFLVWWIGFLLVAGHFNHVVISACEVMMAFALGAPITVGQWAAGNFVPALLGNLVGGVVFVTVLGYAQAHSLRQGEQKVRESAHRR